MASFHDPNFYYPTPILKNGKWIPTEWIEEKDCLESNEACGKGLHLMKVLIPKYQQYRGNCYEAEGEELLGEDGDKARFKKIRLIRPIPFKDIFKPFANLSCANLRSADLRSANLSCANLSYASLSYANLSYANLRSANLSYANLSYANLRSANLSYANLSYANLSCAQNIDLVINLNLAYWNKFTQINTDFKNLLSKDRFVNDH
jgi:uncharacterized protein YjbI with pentapeptide repeats